jgi:hypothetical protein
MISLEERQSITALIAQARLEGARLKAACEVGGIARHTRNWQSIAAVTLNPESESVIKAAVGIEKESASAAQSRKRHAC